jgi:hypothetical protein
MSIEKLIKKILTLDKDDLKLIKDRIDLELSIRLPIYSNEDIFFFNFLVGNLKRDIKKVIPSIYLLYHKDRSTYKKLCDTRKFLTSWLKENKVVPSKRNMIVFYDLFYSIMKRRLAYINFPLGLKTILNLSTSFPGFFDQEFPEYCKNGLVGMVFTAAYSRHVYNFSKERSFYEKSKTKKS